MFAMKGYVKMKSIYHPQKFKRGSIKDGEARGAFQECWHTYNRERKTPFVMPIRLWLIEARRQRFGIAYQDQFVTR